MEALQLNTEATLVENLKREHGLAEIYALTADSGESVYVRTPKTGEWRRFRAHMNNPAKRDEAGEYLFKSCLLHPAREEFDRLCERRPGLLDTFASELVEIAGLSKDVEKKVL